MSNDIFAEMGDTTRPRWASLKNPGDNIQGEYVGKTTGIDGYGKKQIIYQIRKEDGVYNAGFPETKKDVHDEMAVAVIGDRIGIKFLGKKDIVKKNGERVKINTYQTAVMSPEGKPRAAARTSPQAPQTTAPAASPSTVENAPKADKELEDFFASASRHLDTPADVTPDDKLKVIEKLAKDKLGLTDASKMKDVVMEATGLAFIKANFDKIISALGQI